MYCSQLFLGEDDGRFSVSEDGSLVIERVLNADAGEYVCEAQSPAGSAFAKTKLDVRGIHLRRLVSHSQHVCDTGAHSVELRQPFYNTHHTVAV